MISKIVSYLLLFLGHQDGTANMTLKINPWEVGSGWGTHVNPWLILVKVWQKPLQYCKVISLQQMKINLKKILKN